ncbi:Response regulator PleD [Burkholderiales bacterium]|nr:MAG: sensor domain-containing diguanylate cyclase [Burkholderiales bacterium]CAG0998123.1 Response regulator PleD [Burkholderiales bacterium]
MATDRVIETPVEQARLKTLYDYCVLDSGREQQFDELVLLASRICEVPIALISLVDIDRLYFKAAVGLEKQEAPLQPSFCVHAIRQSGVMVVPDTTQDPRFARFPSVIAPPHYRFYAAAPLVAPNGSALGTLCVIDHKPRQLTPSQTDSLAILARQIIAQLELRLQTARDPLTGLLHRRYMEEQLAALLFRARRRTTPLSALMLDLDDFRRVNDTAGHSAGDAVLKAVGQLLAKNVRREDSACRYGGDEFVLILPDMTAETAQRRAEVLRTQLRELKVSANGRAVGPITASLGVASYPGHADNPQSLLGAAEQALSRAQALGRDRVLVAR